MDLAEFLRLTDCLRGDAGLRAAVRDGALERLHADGFFPDAEEVAALRRFDWSGLDGGPRLARDKRPWDWAIYDGPVCDVVVKLEGERDSTGPADNLEKWVEDVRARPAPPQQQSGTVHASSSSSASGHPRVACAERARTPPARVDASRRSTPSPVP